MEGNLNVMTCFLPPKNCLHCRFFTVYFVKNNTTMEILQAWLLSQILICTKVFHFTVTNTGSLIVHHYLPAHCYPTKWIHKGINEYKNPHPRKIYTSVSLQAHNEPSFHCRIMPNHKPLPYSTPRVTLQQSHWRREASLSKVNFKGF